MENTRWSWSGVSEDGQTVVLVLWKDRVDWRAGSYADDQELDADWRRRPGHTARVRHLKHCVEQLGGKFRSIIARAEDVNASPRKIAASFPQEKAVWQIDTFDERTGAFTAHILT
jgi:hypothetical protein